MWYVIEYFNFRDILHNKLILLIYCWNFNHSITNYTWFPNKVHSPWRQFTVSNWYIISILEKITNYKFWSNWYFLKIDSFLTNCRIPHQIPSSRHAWLSSRFEVLSLIFLAREKIITISRFEIWIQWVWTMRYTMRIWNSVQAFLS